jgi:hypothetical protein
MNANVARVTRVLVVSAVFGAGYFAGSIGDQPAQAQLGDIGKQALGQAAGSGAMGSVAQMGTSLIEMEQHISALQKNVDTLKKVKTSLGG